jgi:hypothetical protein
MRFLKRKIAMAKACEDGKNASVCSHHPHEAHLNERNSAKYSKQLYRNINDKQNRNKRRRVVGSCKTSLVSRTTKNIVKNYGQAICKFTSSPLALPYLNEFLKRENVDLKGFIAFISKSKSSIDGIQHFRSVLLPKKNDSKLITSYKKMFQDISEVFIKYFSVNWIFHSKVFHREAHLKFRFKMLRRIKNPKLFTYLKNAKHSSHIENCSKEQILQIHK